MDWDPCIRNYDHVLCSDKRTYLRLLSATMMDVEEKKSPGGHGGEINRMTL
jgi:hypothetical protein